MQVTYRDDENGKVETIDLRNTSAAKLPWRIDSNALGLRRVDFEQLVKTTTQKGSFDTSKHIVKILGRGTCLLPIRLPLNQGGEEDLLIHWRVISLADVLEVYTPEVTRHLFASTRPHEFAISFDLDVLKIYEDYDTCEDLFWLQQANEKRTDKERRIFELSQVREVPTEALTDPLPPPL